MGDHMNSFKQLLCAGAVGFYSLTPVWADDTEIFFGDLQGGGSAPNVLFIMDTSGSMDNKDGGTTERIDRVKDALRVIVNNLNNVNLGLMRFSNPGGPVLYPVTYIDQAVATSSGNILSVSVSTGASTNDAMEITPATGTGVASVDSDDIFMPYVFVDGSGAVATGVTPITTETLSVRVDDDSDDAFEYVGSDRVESHNECYITSGGSWDIDSCTVNLEGNDRMVGLRFINMDIPPGVTITEAVLELQTGDDRRLRNWDGDRSDETKDAGDSDDLEVAIYGQLPDSGTFDRTDGTNISDRFSGSVTSPVNWDIPVYSDDESVTSVDFSSVIQEVIDQPGWDNSAGSTTNDITLLIKHVSGVGERNFQARDRTWSDAPTLRVTYTDSPAGVVAEPTVVGVRFEDVRVPKGAVITEAYLDFEAAHGGNIDTDLTISIEDTTAPAAYDGTLGDITGRATTGAVDWTDVDAWSSGTDYQSADIKSLIQPLVNHTDWCGGMNMAFVITGTQGMRAFKTADAADSNGPVLRISYEQDSVTPGASCIARTINKQIVSGADDGHVTSSGAPYSSGGNTIQINDSNYAVLRYTDLELLSTSTIQSAYLVVRSALDVTGGSEWDIAVELDGDPAPLVGADGVTGRSFSSPVRWSIAGDWTDDDSIGYQSSDITALIEAALAQGSWVQRNDMLFRITKASGEDRNIYSHDYGQLQSVQLVVNFIDDGSSGADTVRDELLRAVDSLSAEGYTPIQDTVYEAHQYYTGGEVTWGKYRGGHDEDGTKITLSGPDGPFDYTRLSAEQSIQSATYSVVRPSGCTAAQPGDDDCTDSNGTGQPVGEHLTGTPMYDSPIDDFCQINNHIIMLTDGEANEPHSESLITDNILTPAGLTCDTSVSTAEHCVTDLTRHMSNADMSPLSGTQRVVTHTIGFNFSSTWLEDVATVSGGLYREAGSSVELVNAINEIVGGALDQNTTFVAPVAAINQFNRLNHLNEIYFAVFSPEEFPRWPGNLKKYKLGVYGGESNVILDQNDAPAVEASNGFFKDTSQSFWSATADGFEVQQGGAGANFPSYSDLGRNVYTYLESVTGQSKVLSNAANAIKTGNTVLTDAILGVSAVDRDTHIEWIRGKDTENEDGDASTDTRYVMGDPLHSKPVAITYGDVSGTPDVTLYVGTNSGAIHAINSSTGAETFAYIPEDILPLQADLRANVGSRRHIYGMDGSITPWVHDNLNDGISTSDPLDFVYIYSGMRRGGRNYYALDVTDRANPEILWTIKGGVTTGFEELGQSWGRPIPGRIKLSGSAAVDVLYISGGYDPAQDSKATRSADSQGRALYIVNAKTGALIWSGGPTAAGFTKQFTDMQYSIPSTLTVADADSDGLDDLIFVGDTGGQVWRFDIKVDETAANLVSGGVIADLGVASGSNTEILNRRFYHGPDVALVKGSNGLELAVTIGSGYRAGPLNRVTEDRFYMLRQSAVFGPPATYTKIAETDLFDTTDNIIGDGTDAEKAAAQATLATKSGWFIDFPRTGEKVLSTPLTYRGEVTFTTYEPASSSASCIPKAGTSRVYQINIADAQPVHNWDTIDPNYTEADRSMELGTASIIDEPVVICTGDGCDMFVGAERPPLNSFTNDRIVKTFWRKDD